MMIGRSGSRWWSPVVVGLALSVAVSASAGQVRWGRGPSAPGPRAGHAMVSDAATGRVYVFGGTFRGGDLADMWLFTSATGWLPGPSGPPAREDYGMAFDSARGVLVIFGGRGIGGLLNDTWEFDGFQWSQGPAAPPALTPRHNLAMAFLGGVGVVLFGGEDGADEQADTWIYDGIAWVAGPVAPVAMSKRQSHAMAGHPGIGRIVLFGGRDGLVSKNDTWEFDGAAWSAGAVAPPSLSPRSRIRMAYLPAVGAVMLFGGRETAGILRSDTWLYDGTWSAGPSAPAALVARGDAALATDGNDVLLFGGSDLMAAFQGDTWRFDGGAWSVVTSPVPAARVGSAMAFDGTNVVLFGGLDASTAAGRLDDTWIFDGTSWSQGPAAPPLLTPRSGHGMAYDAGRNRVLLLGGRDAIGLRSDLWQLQSNQWTLEPAVPGGLTPRAELAIAYDSVRQATVVVGGNDGALRNDVWELDAGGTWVAGVAPPPGLTPRAELAIAYDATRSTMVLFGGEDAGGPRNDAWEYDGSVWSAGVPAPVALTPRKGFGMVYHPYLGNGLVVVFGGWDGTSVFGGLWEYDGSQWFLSNAPPSDLTPRYELAIAYDGVTGRAVVFGGADPAYRSDTWEFGAVRQNFLAGRGLGLPNRNQVRVLDEQGTGTFVDFDAFSAGGWGVNVAAGRASNDTLDDILAGPGPGDVFGPQVKAFRDDGTAVAKINFYAYGTLKYGVNVGGGETDGDGYDEILAGAGPGAVFGPHVRGFDFDASVLTPIAGVNFFAYGTLKYGVNASGCDLDFDLVREIVTGPGPGAIFGPQVRAFNVDGAPVTAIAKINFNAFATPSYGVNVGGGDVDGDLAEEIAATPGPGAGVAFQGRFRGFDYDAFAVAAIVGFDVVAFTTEYGGRVGLGDVGGGPEVDLVAGAGRDPAASAVVKSYAYDPAGMALGVLPVSFDPFVGATYGVNATAGLFGF